MPAESMAILFEEPNPFIQGVTQGAELDSSFTSFLLPVPHFHPAVSVQGVS